MNKTPLSYRTNRVIGGDAPSAYLARLPKQGGAPEAEIDRHLRSHLIDPEALRSDDFDGFIAQRQEAIPSLIEKATGRPIHRGTAVDEPTEDVLDDEETEAVHLDVAE